MTIYPLNDYRAAAAALAHPTTGVEVPHATLELVLRSMAKHAPSFGGAYGIAELAYSVRLLLNESPDFIAQALPTLPAWVQHALKLEADEGRARG